MKGSYSYKITKIFTACIEDKIKNRRQLATSLLRSRKSANNKCFSLVDFLLKIVTTMANCFDQRFNTYGYNLQYIISHIYIS